MNSDPAGDMYLMDFIGMLGIPLIPTAKFPEDADTIFLPAQAADDPEVEEKLRVRLERGLNSVLTAGFLSRKADTDLHEDAGLGIRVLSFPSSSPAVLDGEKGVELAHGLAIETYLKPSNAIEDMPLLVLLYQSATPFLTRICANSTGISEDNRHPQKPRLDTCISVLNVHTYSQEDFDAVDEVLLAPHPLGLLDLPISWTDTLQREFLLNTPTIHSPARVTCQPLDDGSVVIQNYNDEPVTITIDASGDARATDLITDTEFDVTENGFAIQIAARDRTWMRFMDLSSDN